MDINVQNLDLGYNQCEDLNRLAKNQGENLLGRISANIYNLKSHWIGLDATAHINNLITVNRALGLLLADAVGVSSSAADKIIAMQRVRNANGGGGQIGSELTKVGPTAESIAPAEATDRYFCDPAARADLEELTSICEEYHAFVENFNNITGELMSNWTMGANREGAKASFDEFAQNTVTYEKFLADARENLSTAVSNLSQL